MRWIFLLFVLTASFSAGAQPQVRADGNWWRNELTEELRIGYAAGFIGGVELAGLKMPGAVCEAQGLPNKLCNDVGFKAYEIALGTFIRLTPSQFRDGIDTFYSDYRNRRVKITFAVNYVIYSIAGAAAPDLDRAVENLRRNAD